MTNDQSRRAFIKRSAALAWTLAQGSTVIPIPGTRKLERLEENIASAEVKLDAADLELLDALPEAKGARY